MTYEAAPLPLKDGSVCFFRNPIYSDAAAFAGFSYQVRTETDFLLALPEEVEQNTEKVAQRLEATTDGQAQMMLCAFVDGKLIGFAIVGQLGSRRKVQHRATFGISILKDYWGLGIGTALMEHCIRYAENAGFLQLELDVVADNESAVKLYRIWAQPAGVPAQGWLLAGSDSDAAGAWCPLMDSAAFYSLTEGYALCYNQPTKLVCL